MVSAKENYNNVFGDIDLELLDLILKGYFVEDQKVLDIGCGEGRNLIYFLQKKFDIYAIDKDRSAVDLVRFMFEKFDRNPEKVIHRSILEDLSDIGFMDAIICCRVLHFSENNDSFLEAWRKIHQILKTGGILYLSMDSMIGFQNHITKVSGNKYQFKDGSVRFLLDEQLLDQMKISDGYEFLSPAKTIHYENRHAQTVLCLKKR